MEQFLDVSLIIESTKNFLALYGLKVIAAILIFIFGRIAASIIRRVVTKVLRKSKTEPTLVSFVSNLTYAFLLAFFIIAALGKLGVQTASFVTVLGAAGLAIGLALQGSLSNFAAGVLLILFKPFKVGDFIEGGDSTGTVEGISIFTTELKTPDNKLVIIPNAKLTTNNIINYSAKEIRRVDMVIGVGYSDNLSKVRKVITRVLNDDQRILKDPLPTIGVLELADSSVNFAVRPWVKTPDYWDVFFNIQEKIKTTFDEEGISIPFPQQDVHYFQEKKPV